MALVVSDTSPIRALHHLSLLYLLDSLFDVVLVPPAVADELLNPLGDFTSIDIAKIACIRIQAPTNQAILEALFNILDAGESEAIALALELDAELLIDESTGRREASRRGLRIIGVLGLLLRAKHRQLIPLVLPLVYQLRDELGFFVSASLLDELRILSGER